MTCIVPFCADHLFGLAFDENWTGGKKPPLADRFVDRQAISRQSIAIARKFVGDPEECGLFVRAALAVSLGRALMSFARMAVRLRGMFAGGAVITLLVMFRRSMV